MGVILEANTRLLYHLKGLSSGCNVLHLGAHPDDEDVGLLAYLACKHGFPTYYWSATRGEGGQNRVSQYQAEALGVFRTWESLDARAHDRAACLFGPFFDFGFSKTADDALSRWGREEVVREIVRAIRTAQPRIVIARWQGHAGDFHGQHQAVGQAALDAFDAAGDPRRYPELRLPPWRPLKFYQSIDSSGGDQSAGGALNLEGKRMPELEKDGILRVNTGEFDPISGMSYQQRAWIAYNHHRTQGMGVTPKPGDFYYYYRLTKSLVAVEPREQAFTDGFDSSLVGLADHLSDGKEFLRERLLPVHQKATLALENFRLDERAAASMLLMEACALLRELNGELQRTSLEPTEVDALRRFLAQRLGQFEDVAARCSGLELEGLSNQVRTVPGDRLRVSAALWSRRDTPVDSARFQLAVPQGWSVGGVESEAAKTIPDAIKKITPGGKRTAEFDIEIEESVDLSGPYWLVQARDGFSYRWPENPCAGQALSPRPEVICQVQLYGTSLTLRCDIVCRSSFPGGYRELAPAVLPPVSIHPKVGHKFLPPDTASRELDLTLVVRNHSRKRVDGRLALQTPAGWTTTPREMEISMGTGEAKGFRQTVTVPGNTAAGTYNLDYRIQCGDRVYTQELTPVRKGSPGVVTVDASNCIREEQILTPARVTVHLIDTKFVPGQQYAYITGAAEQVRDSLALFGVNFTVISDAELGFIDFSQFDAVVVGPNAFVLRDELRKNASRLLDYIEQGGTLIVQYQTYRYQEPGLAPHPIRYNQPHDRVTIATMPIEILDSENPLFHFPNPITDHDFEGWERDRGMYFIGEWDQRYTPLLSCADSGEAAKHGGLLECHLGKGTYIYMGYTLFRQLPQGVPGAFRLFANLLGVPEARILQRMEFLKKIPLFEAVPPEHLHSVARIMTNRWLADGTYLCRQGEEGQEMYIVRKGELEIAQESDGKEKVVFVAGEGACVGEFAVVGKVPRTASLRARGDAELLVIEGPHFLELIRKNPELSIQVMQMLVARLTTGKG